MWTFKVKLAWVAWRFLSNLNEPSGEAGITSANAARRLGERQLRNRSLTRLHRFVGSRSDLYLKIA